MAQVVGESPVRQLVQTLGRDRRAGHGAAETLQALAVMTRHRRAGVQREARVDGTVVSLRWGPGASGSATTRRDPLARLRPEGQATLDARGLHGSQRRGTGRQRLGGRPVEQITPTQQRFDAHADRLQDVGQVAVPQPRDPGARGLIEGAL